MPSWDFVQPSPLWTYEEWADLRIALARRIKEPVLSTSDGEQLTTIWLNKLEDGVEAHEARAKAAAITTGKAIPYAITLNDYKMVCAR